MIPFPPASLPASVRDPRVLEAMEVIPRARFLPDDVRAEADRDVALPIGHGQTISQPFVVAYMTGALNVGPGAKVLEIGTGSGYQAAILAEMGVDVWSIEAIPELSRRAGKVLDELGLSSRVHLRVGDGWHGWPSAAPFDGILCAAAPLKMPIAFLEQAKDGARIVIPLGAKESQVLRVIEKRGTELLDICQLAVRFVPLVRLSANA